MERARDRERERAEEAGEKILETGEISWVGPETRSRLRLVVLRQPWNWRVLVLQYLMAVMCPNTLPSTQSYKYFGIHALLQY